VQVDYNLPERFELEYVAEDNSRQRPVMIHRAPFGSLERFVGILIEHFNGAFPAWLSPVQAMLIPIADRHEEPAYDIMKRLVAAGIRAEVDDSRNRMGNKIRLAREQNIPYMLVLGDRDLENGTVSVRLRDDTDLGAMSIEDFLLMAQRVIAEQSLELQ
jgi:threonyl-tRNA synthetase